MGEGAFTKGFPAQFSSLIVSLQNCTTRRLRTSIREKVHSPFPAGPPLPTLDDCSRRNNQVYPWLTLAALSELPGKQLAGPGLLLLSQLSCLPTKSPGTIIIALSLLWAVDIAYKMSVLSSRAPHDGKSLRFHTLGQRLLAPQIPIKRERNRRVLLLELTPRVSNCVQPPSGLSVG